LLVTISTGIAASGLANAKLSIAESNRAVSEDVLEDARGQLLQSVRAAQGTVSNAMLPTYATRVSLCPSTVAQCQKTAHVTYAIVGGTDVAPNNDGTDSVAPNVNVGIGEVIVPIRITAAVLSQSGITIDHREGMVKYRVYPQAPYADEIGFEDASTLNGVGGQAIGGEVNSSGCGLTATDCHPNAVQTPDSTLLTADQNCVSTANWSCTGAPAQPNINSYQTQTDANENNATKAGAFSGSVLP
jgi:hypothetical protein